MRAPHQPGLTRRALLAGVGSSVLLAAAGCNPFSSAGKTLTVTAQAPPPTALMLGLIYKTRWYVQRLEVAIANDKRDAAVLRMLLHDRQAHLAALQAEYDRSIGQSTTASSSAPTAGATEVTMATDPDEVIAAIRGDAGEAQVTFTDAMSAASRYRAQLFASIAACLATHRAVLA